MVDQQSQTLQWSIGYTTIGTCPYSDRFIQKRLGDCMSRDQNRRSVVQEGTESTYQSPGTSGHKPCHLDINQNVENISYTYLGRQNDSLELFAENGADKESRSNEISKKIWGFYLGRGSGLLSDIYQGISIGRQIGNLITRQTPQNGDCAPRYAKYWGKVQE